MKFADLEDLYEQYRSDPAFEHLRTASIFLVPGFGASRPEVLLVGEAPGAVENVRGRPFCGPSGRVLDGLMDIAGLHLDDDLVSADSDKLVEANAFVTNVVKYRPPGNRTPKLAEIEASRPYVRAEWRLLGSPPVIVAVGSVAKAALGGVQLGPLSVTAGKPVQLNPTTWLWPMFHPAYGLRNPAARKTMETHWRWLAQWMEKRGVGKSNG